MSTIKSLLNEIKNNPQFGDINYGFDCLNDKLNVLSANSIITIFGTIAKGKTSFALNLALNAAKNGTNILYFSNKERATTLAKKILAIESGVNCEKIHKHDFNEEEFGKINNAKASLEKLNISIEEIDSFKDETQRIEELLKSLSKEKKTKLVIYDEYDNLNVLSILKRCLNIYNFTLIIINSVCVHPYATFGELYTKVNSTLEAFSDCVIGIHKEDFIKNYKKEGILFANIYKLRNGKLSTIKYILDNSNFRIKELGKMEYKELVKCHENMLL